MACIKIAQLDNLTCFNDDSFSKTFTFNLEKVCEYTDNDIQNVLASREDAVINRLRTDLRSELITKEPFTGYINRALNERAERSQLFTDIIVLGRSIVRGIADTNLDESFKPEPQVDLNDKDQLISFVLQLKTKYEDLEIKYNELKFERNSLDTRVTFLESRLGKFDDPAQQNKVVSTQLSQTQNDMDLDLLTDVSDNDADNDKINEVPKNITTQDGATFDAKSKPKPVIAGPQCAYAFIGGVHPEIDSKDILFHINTYSKLNLKPSDVKIEPTRNGSNRAFKVAVPQDKLNELTQSKNLWEDGIKVAPYNRRNPNKKQQFNNNFPNKTSKGNQAFRGSNTQWANQAKPVKPGPPSNRYSQSRFIQSRYNQSGYNQSNYYQPQHDQPQYRDYWR